MRVTIEQVEKRFDRTPVLREISLAVEDHELFFLLGPSGCGKTTLLRLIAGFYEPDHGELRFDDRRMNDVPPHRRNTGMVFQNYALWPHLTVAENVVYGLDVRRLPAAAKRERVTEALAMVRMEAYRDRSPNQLSGGQQQRVALARALVVQPDVLLLDEPLSNLDAQLRLEMRTEIRRIHQQTRITTIYVTHDQEEALSMADRIAVMREGRLEQLGDPRTLYRRPANRFVGDFIGECNWLAGEVVGREPAALTVRTDHGLWRAETGTGPVTEGPVWVGFRPEAVILNAGPQNGFVARIEQVTYLGRVEQYRLLVGAATMLKAVESNPVALRRVGEEVPCHVPAGDLIVVPR